MPLSVLRKDLQCTRYERDRYAFVIMQMDELVTGAARGSLLEHFEDVAGAAEELLVFQTALEAEVSEFPGRAATRPANAIATGISAASTPSPEPGCRPWPATGRKRPRRSGASTPPRSTASRTTPNTSSLSLRFSAEQYARIRHSAVIERTLGETGRRVKATRRVP